MEYTKNYFEKDLETGKSNKLRQTLQNVAVKENTTVTCRRKTQRKSIDQHISKTNKKIDNKCQDVKVRETYDQVLDLRNTVMKGSLKDKGKNCITNKSSDAEQKFLDKVCEYPNMHYKIMTLCSVKNSSKFTEQFNTKTNIISERIVNKQLELKATEKPPSKTKPVRKVLPKFGEKVVIQNILEKEKEIQQKNLGRKTPKETKSNSDKNISNTKPIDTKSESNPNENTPNEQISKPKFPLTTTPETNNSKTANCYEIAKSRFKKSIIAGMSKAAMPINKDSSENSSLETKKSNASRGQVRESRPNSLERSRPRFLLSTKPTRRCAVSHSSIQANIDKSSTCVNTQTENMIQLKNVPAQTCKRNITNEKKMQTRLCKTDNMETDPIFIEGPAKYTSTTCDYHHSEQPTQMYEYLTTSDLVCLDWVNKHLFGVRVNPHNIIVDDKIKEVSEVASKSTFLSELQLLPLPR